MIYVLFGDEDFLLQEELGRIKAGLGPEDMVGLNTTRLAGQSLSFSELQAVCDAVPFLAPNRLVIVEGLLRRFEPGRVARRSARSGQQSRVPEQAPVAQVTEQGDVEPSRGRRATGAVAVEEGWRRLGDYASQIPETTHLVFLEGSLNRANPLLGLLRPMAQVQEVRRLRGPALEQWVREQAARKDIRIVPAALKLLTQVAGEHLQILNSELEKLSLYAGDMPVQPQHVEVMVASARESTIFSLIDAVAERLLPRAQHDLHQLLRDGWAPPQILYRLSQQFRLLLLAKALGQQGITGQPLMNRLGIRSEFPFRKAVEQARRYPVPVLEDVLRRLLDTDVAIKTGRLYPEVALELLVTDLCRGTP